ncbi:hypothetical protein AMECASPLE_004337 [Ameca splendens]|uniref:Uncharacterized protein n=1 Tax=Ameca splendens TaxID=208324 RepID=A0ABV0YKW1_9TELE
MKCFLDIVGGHQQAKKYLQNNRKNLLYRKQLTKSFLPDLLLFTGSTVHQFFIFYHLTHIENSFLGGAAPETRPKPLIQFQITCRKPVTSALGRIASHGGSSSPYTGRHTFFYHIHTSSVM